MTHQRKSRLNRNGKRIRSNFGVTRISESCYECDGCGAVFHAFDMPARRKGAFSLSADGDDLYKRNRARALEHADSCEPRR